MTCSKVRTSLSAMIDSRLCEPERADAVQHLIDCADCRRQERELRFVAQALREATPQRPPVDLTYRLRVLASHERARMLAGADWWSTIRFRLNQILRPLAVPAAGGIFASLLFFAILVPNFTVHANTTNDVPVGLYTQVSIVNLSPFAFSGHDVMVELTIDENGAVSDYALPGGQLSKDEMRAVGNILLFTSFKAATAFGQPKASKMLLNISHTTIDVRS
jgi:hypothetical protein